MSGSGWGPGWWGLMPWGSSTLPHPLDISYRTITYGRIVYRSAVLVDHLSKMGSP